MIHKCLGPYAKKKGKKGKGKKGKGKEEKEVMNNSYLLMYFTCLVSLSNMCFATLKLALKYRNLRHVRV